MVRSRPAMTKGGCMVKDFEVAPGAEVSNKYYQVRIIS